MLEDFLKRLGRVTGRTYTKEEFGKILAESSKVKLIAEVDEAAVKKITADTFKELMAEQAAKDSEATGSKTEEDKGKSKQNTKSSKQN